MKIPIKTDTNKFYRQLVGLLSNFDPVKGLRSRELDVLAELMRHNYNLRDIKNELRSIVLFSKETKRLICNELEMSEDTLNNNLSILRKNGLISKDNVLEGFLNIIPDKTYTLSVVFKLNKDDG